MANKEGQFVAPDDDAFKAAAAGADWARSPGMYVILTDQRGAEHGRHPFGMLLNNAFPAIGEIGNAGKNFALSGRLATAE
jgi:hypothetical protein